MTQPQHHCDHESYCKGFCTAGTWSNFCNGIWCEGKHDTRSRQVPPSCPHWGIEHSDGMEWVCNRPSPQELITESQRSPCWDYSCMKEYYPSCKETCGKTSPPRWNK